MKICTNVLLTLKLHRSNRKKPPPTTTGTLSKSECGGD